MRGLILGFVGLSALPALLSGQERGLDSFAEVRSVETEDGDTGSFESESGERYVVMPLLAADGEGTVGDRTTTLWVHHRSRWHWDFFSYSSDSWAWVTNAKKDGSLVEVDVLEAHLVHRKCYGDHSTTVKNKGKAHAYFRITGVAVCKADITGWACAEKEGYGRWCSNRTLD